jgi:hypothetical protein
MIFVGLAIVIVVTFGPGFPVHRWPVRATAYVTARAEGSPGASITIRQPVSAIMSWTNGVTAAGAHGKNPIEAIGQGTAPNGASLATIRSQRRGLDSDLNRP